MRLNFPIKMWRWLMLFGFTFTSLVSGNDNCPKFQKPFPYRTPFPIDIDSKKATVVNASSPLVVILGALSLLEVQNTGKSIETAAANRITDRGYITGGILCTDVYQYYKARFYINHNGSRSANAVDGVGSPLEAFAIFRNIKYNTIEKALKQRDGMVVLSYRITIGPVPNPLFLPVQLLLELGILREPGSSVFVLNTLLYLWFDVIPLIHKYYVYPGSYIDPVTGEEHDAATYILTTPKLAFLSQGQFESFKKAMNANGLPIETTQPLAPQGRRPIFQVFGEIEQRFILF